MEMENVPGSAWVMLCGSHIPGYKREDIKSFLGGVAKGAAEYVAAERGILYLIGKDESELAVINAEIMETKKPKIEYAVATGVKAAGDTEDWKRLICADCNELDELRVLLKDKEGNIIGIIRAIKRNGKFKKYDKYLLENYANRVAIPLLENVISCNES